MAICQWKTPLFKQTPHVCNLWCNTMFRGDLQEMWNCPLLCETLTRRVASRGTEKFQNLWRPFYNSQCCLVAFQLPKKFNLNTQTFYCITDCRHRCELQEKWIYPLLFATLQRRGGVASHGKSWKLYARTAKVPFSQRLGKLRFSSSAAVNLWLSQFRAHPPLAFDGDLLFILVIKKMWQMTQGRVRACAQIPQGGASERVLMTDLQTRSTFNLKE